MRRFVIGAFWCGLCVFASGRARAEKSRRAVVAEEQVMVTPAPAGDAPSAPADMIGPPPALAAQPAPPASPPPAVVAPPASPNQGETAPPPAAPAGGEKNMTGGYLPGSGFVLRSEDDAFRLRIGLQAGYKFEPVYQNGSFEARDTFFVLRPILSGNFFKPWIHFWTSIELAANPPYPLDTYIEFIFMKEFGLRIGQQYTPYDRHEYFGPQEILFPEWAPVSEYYWTGRDKGVTALGTLGDGGQADYWLGVYSGTPLRQYNALPGNYVLEARITVNPLGPVGGTEFPYIISDGPAPFRVSFTLQGYYGKVQSSEQNFNPSTFSFQTMATGETVHEGAGGADLWIQGSRFVFYLDGTIRRAEPMGESWYTSMGLWGQLGFLLVDRTLDAAVRVNWLNPSTSLSDDQFYSVEGQIAYYPMHTQNLVVKFRYGLGHQSSPGEAALGSVPLVIATPGRTQLFTTQINLAF